MAALLGDLRSPEPPSMTKNDDGSRSRRGHKAKRMDNAISSTISCETLTCLICGTSLCTLTTHRLSTLAVLRRLAKSNKCSTKMKVLSSSRSEDLTHTPISPAGRIFSPPSPLTSKHRIDPFTPFPIQGVTDCMKQSFHDFFSHQGGSIHDKSHGLGFDEAHFPYLFPQAMQNPALCMSFIAMARTFTAVHGRDAEKADETLLSTYSWCFKHLRTQITIENSEGISVSTIMAATNLAMCCGIGLGDADAARTHWKGILALHDAADRKICDGRLVAFRDSLEYWVILMTDLPPRDNAWLVPLAHQTPPLECYGSGFREVFQSPMLVTDSASRLLALCLNSCRAIEILEEQIENRQNNPGTSYNTYFMYLRRIVEDQNAKMFHNLKNTNTASECISLTVNLFYIMVLRMTPWKAPLQILCRRLQTCLSMCEKILVLNTSTVKPDPDEPIKCCSSAPQLRSLYLWMLVICACASQLSHDTGTIEWTSHQLRKFYGEYITESEHTMWQQAILQNARRFCWSDIFLSRRVVELLSNLSVEGVSSNQRV